MTPPLWRQTGANVPHPQPGDGTDLRAYAIQSIFLCTFKGSATVDALRLACLQCGLLTKRSGNLRRQRDIVRAALHAVAEPVRPARRINVVP